MAKTSTFSVDNVGDPEPVIIDTNCTEVMFGEDPSVANFPTTDWTLRAPSKTDTPIRQEIGTQKVMRPPKGHTFDIGQIVAYVATVIGTTTFRKWELP